MKKNTAYRSAFVMLLFAAVFACVLFSARPARADDVEVQFSTAKAISVNKDIKANVTTGYDKQWRLYKFKTTAPGAVTISLNYPAQSKKVPLWNLKFFNKAHEEIESVVVSGKDKSVTMTKMGLPAGIYYVYVGSVKHTRAMSTDTFTLKAAYKKSAVWETEFNDTAETANTITVNKKYYGTTRSGYENEADYFKVNVPKDGKIRLTFAHAAVAIDDYLWKVTLYDGNMRELYQDKCLGKTTEMKSMLMGVRKGTYYIKVTSFHQTIAKSNGTYNITLGHAAASNWEKELNETFGTASAIKAGTTYYGTTRSGYEHEVDYYAATLSKDGYVRLGFKHNANSDTRDYWRLTLYDANQEVLYEACSPGNVKETKFPIIGVKKGKYYIKVTSFQQSSALSTGTYAVTLAYKAASVWEKEFNESFETATPIQVNTDFFGTVRYGYDKEKDYFSVELPEDGAAHVKFAHNVLARSGSTWLVTFYNESFEPLLSGVSAGEEELLSLPVLGLRKGKYYIKVTGFQQTNAISQDKYTVAVEFEAGDVWEKELNESKSAATPMAVNTDFFGTTRTGYNQEQDFFAVTLPSDGDIQLKFTHGAMTKTGNIWTVYLLDGDGNELFKSFSTGEQEALSSQIFRGVKQGTYFIKVTSAQYSNALSFDKYTVRLEHTPAGA